jgi:hypothetical protein
MKAECRKKKKEDMEKATLAADKVDRYCPHGH